jgi:STE24 endopeptidase
MLTPEDIDRERQREAKAFARSKYRLLVAEMGLGGGFVLAVLLTGMSVQLKGWVTAYAAAPIGAVAGYFVLFSVGYGLVMLPVGYYSSFVLPHRYGLSNETVRGWLWDWLKGGVVVLALGLVVVEVMYYLLRVAPQWWWQVSGGFLVLLTVVLANLAPVILVPLFYKVEPLTDEELVGRLERLATRARTRVRGVFTIDLSSKTSAANAMLMGLGNTRRIVLGDTLYADYGPEEIEAILAHELGHHVGHDMWWGMVLQAALTFGGLYLSHLALEGATGARMLSGMDDVAGMPLVGLVVGAFLGVTSPLANTLSRWREGLADEYALRVTGNPQAFVSVMVRLANQNLADVDPERWVELLLYSHPAIGKRIERGWAFAQAMSEADSVQAQVRGRE